MSDMNKELQNAAKKLENAEEKLSEAASALKADQFVQAVVDDAVPDLAQNAPQAALQEAPPKKAGSLDEALSALAENAAKTKFDEQVAEAES